MALLALLSVLLLLIGVAALDLAAITADVGAGGFDRALIHVAHLVPDT